MITQNTSKLKNDPGNWVAAYLGNGIIGGCFGYTGLQFQEGREDLPRIIGDTYFVSQYHYVHGNYGMDYALPIGRLQASFVLDGKLVQIAHPKDIAEVEQRLQMDEGVLYTDYAVIDGSRVSQQQFFSQKRKNLFVLRAASTQPMEFRFKPIGSTPYHYGSRFETEVREIEIAGCKLCEIPTNLQTTTIALKQEGELVLVAVYSTIQTSDPKAACLDEIDQALDSGFDELIEEQRDWWKEYWAESNVTLPHPLGTIWQRANYYIGCSLADVETHPPLVFGLARVQWPSYFPQDYFYAYENLLKSNHLKQAAATSAFWHEILPHAKGYARRMFELDGAVYPWTPPVFDWHDYHHNNATPNACYYEMHNSAYVAKMCYDYYLHTGDEEYLREKAYPVIADIARMYASMTTIENGRAQILFTPNKSQDEHTPKNLPNFFDTLVSAECTLTLARDLAHRFGDTGLASLCSGILDTGYAYDRLEFQDIYSIYEGDTRTKDFQKHPVQLNPITFLPIPRFFSDRRVANYHHRRYEIGQGYKDGSSKAWTLGQFMLASCRLRRPDELAEDIRSFIRCAIMDPDYIQTFESSHVSPHFLTTIGLVMQAVTETLLQTHTGTAEFFPCIPADWKGQEISFTGLRIPGGFTASGRYLDRFSEIRIHSSRGGRFTFSICGEMRQVRVVDEDGTTVYTGPAGKSVGIDTTQGHVYVFKPAG